MIEFPPDEDITVDFGKGCKYGIELVMDAQTATLREALAEVENVPDDAPVPVGEVKRMLRAFARTNEAIAADSSQMLGNAIEGMAPDDPREEGEQDE